jgi:hypothetical protein
MDKELNQKGTLRKIVPIEKILVNESKSNRIDDSFNITKEDRKLRKTIEHYTKLNSNNVLDPTILLREERTENDYYFVCVEGATRIMAIKKNPKIKYLKCQVMNARKGVNEITRVQVQEDERRKEQVIFTTEGISEETREKYTAKPSLKKARMPTMGKL